MTEFLDQLGARIASVGFLLVILSSASVLFACAYWIVDNAGLETWRAMTDSEKPPAVSDEGLVEVRPTSEPTL